VWRQRHKHREGGAKDNTVCDVARLPLVSAPASSLLVPVLGVCLALHQKAPFTSSIWRGLSYSDVSICFIVKM
jgi:hypothetical protein